MYSTTAMSSVAPLLKVLDGRGKAGTSEGQGSQQEHTGHFRHLQISMGRVQRAVAQFSLRFFLHLDVLHMKTA